MSVSVGRELLAEINTIEDAVTASAEDFWRLPLQVMVGRGHLPMPYDSYNFLPSNNPIVVCQETILVMVKSAHRARELVLEAALHVNMGCPKTKYVVFWAKQWDASLWFSRQGDFNKVKTTLKLFGHRALEL